MLNKYGHREFGIAAKFDEMLEAGTTEEFAMEIIRKQWPHVQNDRFKRHLYWFIKHGAAIEKSNGVFTLLRFWGLPITPMEGE